MSETYHKRKSALLKQRLQNIYQGLDIEDPTLDEAALTVKLDMLEKTFRSFEAAHEALEQENLDEMDSSVPVEAATLYANAKTLLTRKLTMHQQTRNSMVRQSTFDETQPSIVIQPQRTRLPIINIPTFGGSYTEWPDFFSMFKTVIDNDEELTKIEKFQYLRSNLCGPALDSIHSLELSDINYDKAIDILKRRFDNKRLNFQAHIRDIVALDNVEVGSVNKLRCLSDSVNSHLRALYSMGTKDQVADCLLIHIVFRKLDMATQTKWEESVPVHEIPTWDAMDKFLQRRCQMMENVECSVNDGLGNTQVGPKQFNNTNRKRSLVVSTNTTKVCPICNSDSHMVYNCQHFLSQTPYCRFKQAKSLNLCLNCLRKGHVVKNCLSSGCRNCSAKHHTLLHLETNTISKNNQMHSSSNTNISSNSINKEPININLPSTYEIAQTTPTSQHLPQSSLVVSNNLSENKPTGSNTTTMLATAILFAKNKSGCLIPCRAVLDSASQANFITSDLASKLQLKQHRTSTHVSGIGQSNISSAKLLNLLIQSCINKKSAWISAVVVPKIVDNQPSHTIDISNWNIPKDKQLADPSFYQSQQIDLLIGGDLFFESLRDGKHRLGTGLPFLQKTDFGWVVEGGATCFQKSNNCLVTSNISSDNTSDDLDILLRRFWEIENIVESVPNMTKDELYCENHFLKNYCRLESGEFSVRLPFKTSPQALGDSYNNALHRFKKLEARLNKDRDLKDQYVAFLNEYKELKHMSLVENSSENITRYFLPHHCVTKSDSTTTKLRVVFDGSAKTSSGLSLNDILMCGPTIQTNLFNILLRFRTFKYALTGDICKMYRCDKVSYPDNFLQCILWRDNPDDIIQIYKLDTVTYGTKSASFLSIRSMYQLAFEENNNYPLGSRTVQRDFYVDDLISGGNSVDEVREILKQTTQLLSTGNFNIRKWCSNDSQILKDIAEGDKESFLKFRDGSDVTKTLGLIWDPKADKFLFSFIPFKISAHITKRIVLSTIAKFYDPLGLIGPVIVRAKIFLQRLWKQSIDWDEPLSDELKSSWYDLCDEFRLIENCKFPRNVLNIDTQCEIHAFCDASSAAYGVCIYVLSKKENTIETHLLCSKSRIAPTQVLTIPRLELSAALILAELVHSILETHIFFGKIYCWSDSTVVLSWIKEESSNYQVFVANRISRIQSLTSNMQWKYVPTNMNPADIISRGATAQEIHMSNLWLHGPHFLRQGEEFWPQQPISVYNLPEKKRCLISSSVEIADLSLNCKYITSFGKISRIYAYIYKFGASNITSRKGPLHTLDVKRGTELLIRMVQRCNFAHEYKILTQGKTLSNSDSLISLNPFVDSFGVLRVGGRLENSELPYETQHPAILPKQHPLTDSIIRYFHEKNMHAGPQSLLATIRLQYWPLGGKREVSRVINKCIRCFRLKPKYVEHIMGNLPKDRVQGIRAFVVVGVDFCGPMYYRSEIRSRPAIKCYISLFVCFATKAVHLELVKDLSTQSFLAALKRFICIRGKPKTIWSDNATNFVGAKNELAELKSLFMNQAHNKAVHDQCLEDGIDWNFIPPRSPHFGGLWEAAIKVAKQHILRTIGLSILGFDELRTLICQVSAIMNSRPLCSISDNPQDMEVLTPGHFLIGAPLTSVAEPDISMLNIHRLDQWQKVCFMQQQFWKRWSTEYLTLLQQRTKWQAKTDNISIGTMVLLKDENQPPLKWQLGRVTDIIKGQDGVVRVALVRICNGIMRRAVSKLCILLSDDVETCELSKGGECSASL